MRVVLGFPENGALPGLSAEETALLSSKISAIHTRIVPAGSEVPLFFKKILDEHRIPGQYSQIVVKTALTELLVAILKSAEADKKRTASGKEFSHQITKACELIKKNLSTEFKVEDIAEIVGRDLNTIDNLKYLGTKMVSFLS